MVGPRNPGEIGATHAKILGFDPTWEATGVDVVAISVLVIKSICQWDDTPYEIVNSEKTCKEDSLKLGA